MRVKIIKTMSYEDLEISINKFLENTDGIKVRDIKYGPLDRHSYASALIIYTIDNNKLRSIGRI